MFLPLIVLNKSLTFSQFLHIAPQLFLWSTRCLVFAVIAWCSMPLEFPEKDVWCVWENKCPLDLNQRTYKWGEPYFIVHVLFARSLKANFSPPPPTTSISIPLHLQPPPPSLLLPLALCLVRSTIVYSVLSRASGDTPKAKATVRGEIVGWGPAEQDTGSILVWERGSCLDKREEVVSSVWL